jgi:uncharacterized repeat protein (TIGR03803 family)
MSRFLRLALAFFFLAALSGTTKAQSGWTETPIQGFAGFNGSFIIGTLIQASDGNFYGTATFGGINNTPTSTSAGVMFQIVPDGTINAFYNFCGQTNCTDGGVPNNRLVQGPDGAIYGTTQEGGANNKGVVFRITLAGAYSVIHSFCSASECSDGSAPLAGLSLAADGTFYGTTSTGGTHGDGVIFSMTAAGAETPLYDFCSLSQCQDGAAPVTNLVQGTDGTLYGATSTSGANGFGTLFSFNPAGEGTFNVVQAFCDDDCDSGTFSNNDLVIESSGIVYGTTIATSLLAPGGVVYAVTPAGQSKPATYKALYTFCTSACLTGTGPKGGLMQASDGNLYGTTWQGGSGSEGIAYTVSTAGAITAIYSFQNNGTDGLAPEGTFVQGGDGSLYLATYNGGSYQGTSGFGAFVKLAHSPALPPPVQLSVSSDVVPSGESFTLNWSVSNAGSLTMQQCYASASGGANAGSWTGKQKVSGSATITPKAAGVYTYALTCGGVESSSVEVSITTGGKANTATTVTASPNPVLAYQNVTLTATVAKVLQTGVPTGSVTFYANNALALGTARLNGSGVATLVANASNEPYGEYSITAKYAGDANDSVSTSAGETVDLYPNASVMVTASPSSVTPPGSVTLTAKVSSAQGTPTGTLTFSIPHLETLATVPLKNGVATLTGSSTGVPAGTYTVLGYYNGAKGYGASGGTTQVTVK